MHARQAGLCTTWLPWHKIEKEMTLISHRTRLGQPIRALGPKSGAGVLQILMKAPTADLVIVQRLLTAGIRKQEHAHSC